MKALTLRHPWPYAVWCLGKDVENRTWAPSPKLLKPGDWFCFHGGAHPTGKALLESIADRLWIMDRFKCEEIGPSSYIQGITSVARFAGVVRASSSPWFTGPVGWVWDDIVHLPDPIPCRGKQGLWEVPAEIVERIGLELRRRRGER